MDDRDRVPRVGRPKGDKGVVCRLSRRRPPYAPFESERLGGRKGTVCSSGLAEEVDGWEGWMDGEDVDVWMDGGSEKVSEVGLLSPGRRRRGCA